MASDGVLRIELFVDDIDRSASFYERALGFVRESESEDYVAIRRGAVRIGIGTAANLSPRHYFDPSSFQGRKGTGVEIVLEVDDVDSACRMVSDTGHAILTPLGDRPWGLRDFRIVDPDGYYLRITSAT